MNDDIESEKGMLNDRFHYVGIVGNPEVVRSRHREIRLKLNDGIPDGAAEVHQRSKMIRRRRVLEGMSSAEFVGTGWPVTLATTPAIQ
jgi:hypothetical protein